ncbi:hypothetical protein [Gillisia sp. JM1]|uniref:hypothetical protein n=1 Tax=Gillisia sp. JM1 TaxID=1283286 RepID=UPI00047C581E|nr:hypothetical protein [Gillisia sp. JM1]
MREKIYKKITDTLSSENFELKLERINRNYPNLKQEIQIRNCLLELINADYFAGAFQHRAFAELKHIEYPNKRVDLTFINQDDIEERYTVELKFQYSNDFSKFNKYDHIIKSDFEIRNSDLFILIVAHWDKEDKKKFEDRWFDEKHDLAPDLNRYISKTECWKKNIPNLLGSYDKCKSENFISLDIGEEDEFNHRVNYNFYFLRRDFLKKIIEVESDLKIETV